jgi:hypothetical protein
LEEPDVDRKVILKITEEAVYKNQIQMALKEFNSSYGTWLLGTASSSKLHEQRDAAGFAVAS